MNKDDNSDKKKKTGVDISGSFPASRDLVLRSDGSCLPSCSDLIYDPSFCNEKLTNQYSANEFFNSNIGGTSVINPNMIKLRDNDYGMDLSVSPRSLSEQISTPATVYSAVGKDFLDKGVVTISNPNLFDGSMSMIGNSSLLKNVGFSFENGQMLLNGVNWWDVPEDEQTKKIKELEQAQAEMKKKSEEDRIKQEERDKKYEEDRIKWEQSDKKREEENQANLMNIEYLKKLIEQKKDDENKNITTISFGELSARIDENDRILGVYNGKISIRTEKDKIRGVDLKFLVELIKAQGSVVLKSTLQRAMGLQELESNDKKLYRVANRLKMFGGVLNIATKRGYGYCLK